LIKYKAVLEERGFKPIFSVNNPWRVGEPPIRICQRWWLV